MDKQFWSNKYFFFPIVDSQFIQYYASGVPEHSALATLCNVLSIYL